MPINFPDSPSINDSFTDGNRTWRWDGTTWSVVPVGSDWTYGSFYGCKLTSSVNYIIDNSTPLYFDTEMVDAGDFFDAGTDNTKIIIRRTGWYWVGANITTLGTDYSGPNNSNVVLAIMKNWDGVSTQLDYYVAFERYDNGMSGAAQGNTLLQQVYLEEDDELQLIVIGPTASGLLIESNPSDGLPGGFPTDSGTGVLSPHFFAMWATGHGPTGPQGPAGADGADGADGVMASVVAGTGIAVDNTDPANPVVSATGGGGSGGLIAETVYTSSATYSTSSGTIADIDAANLSVTFDAPTSGNVLVIVSFYTEGASCMIGLREGSSTVGTSGPMGSHAGLKTARLYIDGLTPSSSYTYKAAWYRLSSGTTSAYGGGSGGVVQPYSIEVWERPS